MGRRLREELYQEREFASLEEEVFLALQRTAHTVLDPWAAFLKREARYTPSQYNLLRILRGAFPSGRTCGEIAERLVTRDPDVTRIVDRLEKRELVRRERDAEDRRVVRVFVTESGRKSLARLDAAAKRMPHALLAPLGAKRLEALRDLLDAVRNEIGAFP